jgi:hypothetical protein
MDTPLMAFVIRELHAGGTGADEDRARATSQAAFAADSAIGAAAVTDDFGLVLAGDAQGCAHFLELVGRPS